MVSALLLLVAVIALVGANVVYAASTGGGRPAALERTPAVTGLLGGGAAGTGRAGRPVPGRLRVDVRTLRWSPGPAGKLLHGYRDVTLTADRVRSAVVTDDRLDVHLHDGGAVTLRLHRPDGLQQELLSRGIPLA